jgi:hypothetical protein
VNSTDTYETLAACLPISPIADRASYDAARDMLIELDRHAGTFTAEQARYAADLRGMVDAYQDTHRDEFPEVGSTF